MTNITVDSRRCGEGKTRDDTAGLVRDKGRVLSTWANIKTRWQLSDRCLVVLPSLALCDYYEQHLTEFLIAETGALQTNQLAKITSQDHANVQSKLHECLRDRCAIVIITQQAWLNSDISSKQRSDYHLIIDEAVMPYREVSVYHDAECLVDFNWAQNTSLLEATDGAVEWNELRFNNIKGSFITDSSDITRDLFNANWRNRVHVDDYVKFAGVIPKTERISVIQELLPNLFDNYASIWIACAAFEYTFMRFWMDAHAIIWKIHPKLQFIQHKVPVKLMGPDDTKFHWSSYKQNNEPELIKQFSQQARSATGGSSVLVLRNNSQNRQIYQAEVKLPHNSAGSNDYTKYKFVSLESALNPTPNMTRFLYAVYGIGPGSGQNGVKDPVHMAQTVYTFYQTVMRCCLREGKPATVFSLDNRVILGLAEFFTNVDFEEIRLVRSADINKPGRPIKENRLTTAQSQKCQRRRDKYPELRNKTNDEIWRMLLSGDIK
jgi:hypothetical protein